MILISLDILGGKVVRLTRGREDTATVYSDDPVRTAQFWAKQGFEGLHIIDLDAALGIGNNWSSIQGILTTRGIFKEVGGGIRDLNKVNMLLSNGADRVMLGTGAITGSVDITKIMQKDRIVIALDKLGSFVAIEGWKKIHEREPIDLLQQFMNEGFNNFLITNIAADGTKLGANLAELRSIKEKYRSHIYVSGGLLLENIDDIRALGYAGVIIGRAAYDRFLSQERSF